MRLFIWCNQLWKLTRQKKIKTTLTKIKTFKTKGSFRAVRGWNDIWLFEQEFLWQKEDYICLTSLEWKQIYIVCLATWNYRLNPMRLTNYFIPCFEWTRHKITSNFMWWNKNIFIQCRTQSISMKYSKCKDDSRAMFN